MVCFAVGNKAAVQTYKVIDSRHGRVEDLMLLIVMLGDFGRS